jgi:hypothetical protein
MVVYGAPLLFAVLEKKKFPASTVPSLSFKPKRAASCQSLFPLLDDAIMSGFASITKLGGYLILFGIFAKMVTAWKTVTTLKAIILSMTEITTSIPYTASVVSHSALRETILFGGLAFGGLSGLAQTKSMTAGSNLSIKAYALARLKITGLALVLAWGCMFIRNLPV